MGTVQLNKVINQGYKNTEHANTDHERFEIRPPPLGQTISNLPLVVDAMGDLVELRTRRRGETVIQTPFETFYFVFAWF